MDFLINMVRNLNDTTLYLIIGAGVFILFLILLILKGSILQSGFRILTKKKIGFYYMIIPTFISILLNVLLLAISYIILTKNDINVLEVIVRSLFNSLEDFTPLLYIIIAAIASEVIFILIQAFILKLINFDIYLSIKKLINKLSKKDAASSTASDTVKIEKADEEVLESQAPDSPSFVNGLLAGLFCFAIMFFLTIILMYIGELVGGRLF